MGIRRRRNNKYKGNYSDYIEQRKQKEASTKNMKIQTKGTTIRRSDYTKG